MPHAATLPSRCPPLTFSTSLYTHTERFLASPSTQPAGPTFPTPPSAIAARVAAFLPTLAAANDALAADVAAGRGDDHNVECVDEGAPHVEIDVAAGVLELGDAAAVRAAEAAVARGNDDDGPMAAQAAASSSESDSDDDGSEESNAGEVGAAPQATTKRRKRAPGITVIG